MASFETAAATAKSLKANPAAIAEYATRDATGEWREHHAVWLDEDGDLVQAHPTDPGRGPIAAPERARYSVTY